MALPLLAQRISPRKEHHRGLVRVDNQGDSQGDNHEDALGVCPVVSGQKPSLSLYVSLSLSLSLSMSLPASLSLSLPVSLSLSLSGGKQHLVPNLVQANRAVQRAPSLLSRSSEQGERGGC